MTKKTCASVDRLEGDYIICISDENSEEILLKKSDYPLLCEKDVIEIVFENGTPVSVEKNQNESEKRLETNSQRLRNLFKRNK